MSRMRVMYSHGVRWSVGALAVVLTVFLAVPAPVSAQLPLPLPLPLPGSGGGVGSQATAVRAAVFGSTATLADTGTLTSASDPLEASLDTGSALGVVSGEVLHAVTVGWSDQVISEASLGNLTIAGGGLSIIADFVMARAQSVSGSGSSGGSLIENLSINGAPVQLTGPNQTIALLGGLTLVINEVQQSGGTITANALHLTSLDGLVDIVVASARAGGF